MKIDVEMITCLTGHFENNEVCDALIKEWETDCTKEEEISIREMKALIEKWIMLDSKKGKKTRHQIEAIVHEAEGKLETVTTDEIKVIALKGLYFHQEITKTEAQEVKPRLIVKNMIKRKETFFQMVGQLQKNLKPS